MTKMRIVYYGQITCQIMFLIFFVLLLALGRIQIWMGIFLASLLLTLFFGRFYCGWLCPIRTIQRAQTLIKKKLRLPDRVGPAWLRSKTVRYVMAALFLLLMTFVLISGRQLPLLPLLLIIGVLLSSFFAESLWHRWLCPYGTLLRLPASVCQSSLKIKQAECSKCGICSAVCPSEAIERSVSETTSSRDSFTINKAECLLCLECVRSCPPKIISYNQSRPTKSDGR